MDTVLPLSEPATKEESLVQLYLRLAKEILLEPSRFYRELAPRFTTAEALCMGLVTLWITSVVSFIFGTANKLLLGKMLSQWLEGVSLGEDSDLTQSTGQSLLFQAGFVLIKPFLSILALSLSALVLFSFAKLFIADENDPLATKRIDYKEILKIVAFAAVASWFSIVPIFGGILAYFAILFVTLIGIREVFRVSTKRAALVVFVPQFMFFMAAMLLIGSAVLVALMLPWDQIMDMNGAGGDEVDSLVRFFLR